MAGFRTTAWKPKSGLLAGQAHCNVDLNCGRRSAAWFNPTFEPPAVGTGSIPDDNEMFWSYCDFASSRPAIEQKIGVRSIGIRSNLASMHDSATLQNTAFSFTQWPRANAKVKTSKSTCRAGSRRDDERGENFYASRGQASAGHLEPRP